MNPVLVRNLLRIGWPDDPSRRTGKQPGKMLILVPRWTSQRRVAFIYLNQGFYSEQRYA